MQKGVFRYLPIEQLAPNPLRPRTSMPRESLLKLADSIRKYGVLTPLLVGETPAGFQIIAGERRFKAAKLAGLREVPCVIVIVKPDEIAVLALVENVQRKDLNLLEQAGMLQKMQAEFKLTLQEIGEMIGLPLEELEEWLKALELPNKIKSAYLAGKIDNVQLLELCQLDNPLEILGKFA